VSGGVVMGAAGPSRIRHSRASAVIVGPGPGLVKATLGEGAIEIGKRRVNTDG
jgi:hypothetical protein